VIIYIVCAVYEFKYAEKQISYFWGYLPNYFST